MASKGCKTKVSSDTEAQEPRKDLANTSAVSILQFNVNLGDHILRP
jgi:hypothetical protein